MEEKSLIQQACEVITMQNKVWDLVASKAVKYIKYHLYPYKVDFKESVANTLIISPKSEYSEDELTKDYNIRYVDTITVQDIKITFLDTVKKDLFQRIKQLEENKILIFRYFDEEDDTYNYDENNIHDDIIIPFAAFDNWVEIDTPEHILVTNETESNIEID